MHCIMFTSPLEIMMRILIKKLTWDEQDAKVKSRDIRNVKQDFSRGFM